VAQIVEWLPSKCEALSSSLSTLKERKEGRKKEREEGRKEEGREEGREGRGREGEREYYHSKYT
jgi:hypothetical protein